MPRQAGVNELVIPQQHERSLPVVANPAWSAPGHLVSGLHRVSGRFEEVTLTKGCMANVAHAACSNETVSYMPFSKLVRNTLGKCCSCPKAGLAQHLQVPQSLHLKQWACAHYCLPRNAGRRMDLAIVLVQPTPSECMRYVRMHMLASLLTPMHTTARPCPGLVTSACYVPEVHPDPDMLDMQQTLVVRRGMHLWDRCLHLARCLEQLACRIEQGQTASYGNHYHMHQCINALNGCIGIPHSSRSIFCSPFPKATIISWK